MCLLTFLPAGVQPDSLALTRGAACNNDGHGFAILIPGQPEIMIRKSMDAASLIVEFVKLRGQYPDGPALFHSRLTTHGETTVDNCHPFVVNNDPRTVVAHNGILPRDAHPGIVGKTVRTNEKTGTTHVIPVYDERSDTRILADDLLMDRWPRLDARKTRKRLTTWLGTGNKILVLTTDDTYRRNAYLFNEHIGTWVDGVWYSNSSFRGSVTYSGSWSLSGSWSSSRSVSSAVGDDWDDWDRRNGWTKDERGIWVRARSTPSWSDSDDTPGDPDDEASWPVTLGGTRRSPFHGDTRPAFSGYYFVTCDLCNDIQVDAEIGLCLGCQACNDCYSDISGCDCYGTPYPQGATFLALRRALDGAYTTSTIRTLLREYRSQTAARMRGESRAALSCERNSLGHPMGTTLDTVASRAIDQAIADEVRSEVSKAITVTPDGVAYQVD